MLTLMAVAFYWQMEVSFTCGFFEFREIKMAPWIKLSYQKNYFKFSYSINICTFIKANLQNLAF